MPMLHPKTNEELSQLLGDLHTTVIAEFQAHHNGGQIDPIKLSTAMLHMMYLVNQEKKAVPILYSQRWSSDSTSEDRIFQVLNGILMLSNPISWTDGGLQMPWVQTANLLLSELLFYITGAPPDWKTCVKGIQVLTNLLGFIPLSGTVVKYVVCNLDSNTNEMFIATYRYRTQ